MSYFYETGKLKVCPHHFFLPEFVHTNGFVEFVLQGVRGWEPERNDDGPAAAELRVHGEGTVGNDKGTQTSSDACVTVHPPPVLAQVEPGFGRKTAEPAQAPDGQPWAASSGTHGPGAVPGAAGPGGESSAADVAQSQAAVAPGAHAGLECRHRREDRTGCCRTVQAAAPHVNEHRKVRTIRGCLEGLALMI